MKRQIQQTTDGSHTITICDTNLSYHSHHGAVQESMHVFIEAGLLPMMEKMPGEPIHILEIGFGTGLNALLSLREAVARQHRILYTSIEKFPLTKEEAVQLNHGQMVSMQDCFIQLHDAAWEQQVEIDPFFTLEKKQLSLPAPIKTDPVHLIYFDAFAPDAQSELWTADFFHSLFDLMATGGALVTYSSKSDVRRAMAAVGLRVEKIPGPRGKREMARAWK